MVKALRDVVESYLDNSVPGGFNGIMSRKPESTSARGKGHVPRTRPVWAEGLRRMYEDVVDEQLPDDFLTLLKQLDDDSGSR
ncbi:MAG TPA: NepR family anti-sigma factor [Sphingobium sp.]|nr:NepR family anti-sigma factor [Sphingobium sp.]